MRRKAVAAVWIAGATVPLLMATVFLVGCCVLPFHHLVHQLMPICEMAANVMRGDGPSPDHEHDAVPPSRETQEAQKRISSDVRPLFRLGQSAPAAQPAQAAVATTYRSFITLGAVRCDHDVGLYVLVDALLI